MPNLELSLKQVVQAIKRCGVGSPQLVAVSKTVSIDTIRQAYDLGQRIFGENRIDVLKPKFEELPKDIEWHFIGNIQSRKINEIVACSSMIHSIGDVEKIGKIDRAAINADKQVKFLLQVNISGEAVKSGFSPELTTAAVLEAMNCQQAQCVGLMTMAPFGASDTELRTIFSELRKLRDELEENLETSLPELSMGMSNDYKIALEEGATLVRVGSAIFKGL